MNGEKKLYLQERCYIPAAETNENTKDKKFWISLLGKELWKRLKHSAMFSGYLNGWKIKKTILERGDGSGFSAAHIEVDFIKFAMEELRKNSPQIDPDVLGLAINDLEWNLRKISIRVIIAELNFLESDRLLKGESQKKKYEYFKKNYLMDPSYVFQILELYPGLYRSLLNEAFHFVNYCSEFFTIFEKNKESVFQLFCLSQDTKIKQISGGMGDPHNGGKSVRAVTFDNGAKIIYKPHTCENEIFFYELTDFLYRKMHLSVRKIKILSYDTHCWGEFIVPEECISMKEIARFYKRIGALAFVSYVLGTGDLHAENLIACGEYPILVDLENLVNQSLRKEDPIQGRFTKSVLFSGLLPVPHWNKNGRGVVLGGLSFEENQKLPIKIPVIKDYGTLDMRVEYEHPVVKSSDNVPRYRGQRIDFRGYESEIIDGFREAYWISLQHKEELQRLTEKHIKKIRNRVIFEDTQKYAMLISSSFHPNLLLDAADREVFLNLTRKGRTPEFDAISAREVESMRDRDIPYFYQMGEEREIYSGDDHIVYAVTEKTPGEVICENIENLTEEDMDWQIYMMKLSFELFRMNRKELMNGKYMYRKQSLVDSLAYAKKIYQRVLKMAIRTSDSIGWVVPKPVNNSWNVQKIDTYLYDGIAGIFVFLNYLENAAENTVQKDVLEQVERELFRYTDQNWRNINFLNRNTGIYAGEGSMIYAYLLVYQITRRNVYLNYAKKHCILLRRNLIYDRKYDLLSGNGGAIFAYLLMHEVTGKKIYINWAKEAAEILMKSAVSIDGGIAWESERGYRPLLGVSHGTGGIAWAFAKLYSVTREMKYQKIVLQALLYEDANYDPAMNDWKDFRTESAGEKHQVAWCHGGGGILLARKNIMELCDDVEISEICQRDIVTNIEYLKKEKDRVGMCLCHGTAGNYEIMRQLGDKNRMPLRKISEMLFQERTAPGFMNGLCGIGYAALRGEKREYPDLLNVWLQNRT